MTAYYDSDESAVGRIRNRQAAAAYRQSVVIPPGYQQLLAQFIDAYPHAKAEILAGFAAAGASPNDPDIQAAIEKSFDVDRKKGFFDHVGDVLGKVTEPLGAALGAGAHVLDETLGGLDEAALPSIKGGIRSAFVVMESPLQEVQTFSRAALATGLGITNPRGSGASAVFGENYRKAGSSSLREVFNEWTDGDDDKIDLGSGFLPDAGSGIETRVRDRAGQLQVKVGGVQFGGPGNPALTVGRAIAANVAEPGETPFNVLSGLVDAGVAWYGDPTSAVGSLAKVGEVGTRVGRAADVARDAVRGEATLAQVGKELLTKPTLGAVVDRSMQGRLIHDVAGRIAGTRKTIDTSAQWYAKGGRRVVDKLAATDDAYEIWQATNKQIPVEYVRQLADAKTSGDVMKILDPLLGPTLDTAPVFNGFAVRRSNKLGSRLRGEMPGIAIDPNDLDGAAEQIDRVLRNGKASPELRKSAFDRVIRNPSKDTLVATLSDVMGDFADELVEQGIKPGRATTSKARARKLTQLWDKDLESVRAYITNEIAAGDKALGIAVGPNDLPVAHPALPSEFLNGLIPLPDAREIRRATSVISKFVDTPMFERSVSAVSGAQSAWKQLTLLRGAYTARVIGEEQLRIAAAGMESAFAHPLSFIASVISDDGRLAKLVGQKAGRRGVDVLGQSWTDEVGEVVDTVKGGLNKRRSMGRWVDEKRLVSEDWMVYEPGQEGFIDAWADGLGELHRDEVARKIAQADGDLNGVKDWFFDGLGRTIRRDLVETYPALATRAGVDDYIDYIARGVKYRTKDDSDLLYLVATGNFRGRRLGEFNVGGQRGMYWRRDQDLMRHLEEATDVPVALKGRALKWSKEKVSAWDNATSWAFDIVGTIPTNKLSRFPVIQQSYWNDMERMIPWMPSAVREEALAGAVAANLPKDQIKRMREAAMDRSASEGVGATRTLDDFDMLAKQRAVEDTKALLYDITDKGQFFDTFRLLFPFGEAWKEVITRWAALGVENPKVFRRGQQVMGGARGAGFFQKDINGEETFTYPFSRQLSKLLIGTPIDLKGRVAGLSLMSEVLPGVGPVVQIPAAALMPDTPDWDFVREVIAPYGDPDFSNGFLESFAPGFLRNGLQFFQKGDPRLFANTVGASMDYLASTGKYDLSNPAETAQMFDDAKDMAKKVYAFRAFAQFVSPTSPLPEFLAQDKTGNLHVAREIINDFHEMQQDEDIGFDGAVQEFLNKYGETFTTETLSLLMQGKSFSVIPTLPVSKEAAEWERDHTDIVDKYKLTWGLFAPQSSEDGDMDYQAYVRQFERGDRQSLTPEQRLALAQARVGNHILDVAKSKLSDKPSKAEREWLAQIKAKIAEQYPGFKAKAIGLPARANLEDIINELKRSIMDPKLSGSRQAKAARLYLQARDRALAYANEQGVGGLDAQAAAPARDWLSGIAKAILARYPEFQDFFDASFSRELDDA